MAAVYETSPIKRQRSTKAEVGARRESTKHYDWLEGRDFLVIRADRKPLLVVDTLNLAVEVVMMAEQGRTR